MGRIALAHPAYPTVFVHPGQFHVSSAPSLVTTILGSCVSVFLWDEMRAVGGVNHFLLPETTGGGASGRFGTSAVRELIARTLDLGATRASLDAVIIGGANVLDAFRGGAEHLGQRNVVVARSLLADEGIRICGEDTGGNRGRRVAFSFIDGSVKVRRLGGGAAR
jgi:chemotaxis protein CheD